MGAVATSGGSTFPASCFVEVVASTESTPSTQEIDATLESVVTGFRGRALRAQLADKHPARGADDIDDAIQTACETYLDHDVQSDTPGEVYAWVRITAHRFLSRDDDRLARQVPTDPTTDELDAIAATVAGPAQQMIDREDEGDLAMLAESVASELPLQRQRDVLALYGAGYKRPEIAARLGIRERVVKRDLLDILDRTRAALVRLAGGGCAAGESLVMRSACGLATPVEESQAQLHLTRCQHCSQFHERLNLWREKVGAVLPIPATEHADPGVLERTLHKTLDGLGSLRQHLADGGAQVKQQATATYYRAADPTPLAGARPGAVVAVVAGCLAVGTGTYTCVEQGVNPFTAIPGVGDRPADERSATPPPDTTTEPTAPRPSPVAVEPVATPDPAPTPAPAEPAEPPPPPPPEQSFEPSSPAYSPPAQSSEPATPAPVASGNGSSEFEP
jgi:DNA-directed RNA polymerase specialized sigma24 family protein